MDFMDYYQLMSESPGLVKAVISFNGLADPPEFSDSASKILSADSFLSKSIARADLRSFFPSEPKNGFWDFMDETRRLVLVDPESFRNACLYWGASVFAADLARVIEKDEVLGLKDRLGLKAHRFALSRGRFYLGSLRNFYRPVSGDPAALTADDLRRTGLRAAAVCSRDWPDELKIKAESKFKISLTGPDDEARSLDLERVTWHWFKKILLEVAPQWRPCFV